MFCKGMPRYCVKSWGQKKSLNPENNAMGIVVIIGIENSREGIVVRGCSHIMSAAGKGGVGVQQMMTIADKGDGALTKC